MATVEYDVLLRGVDSNGNIVLLYPVTKISNVDGLEERLAALSGGGVGAEEPSTVLVNTDGTITITKASSVTTVSKQTLANGNKVITERIVPTDGSEVLIKTTTISPGTGNVKKQITEVYSNE